MELSLTIKRKRELFPEKGVEEVSLRFVIGRSGTGKTTLFLNEMREKLKKQPDGPPIIYIVPEQMTFLSEHALIQTDGLAGMIRTQVYSFTRLAWRILQETGGVSRNHLSSTGTHMLIRKIIEDHKDELKIFQRAADQTGFIQHVENILTEFKHYCIESEELAHKQKELAFGQATRALSEKLHDLELIYSHFEHALIGKYVGTNDYLNLLAQSINQSSYLQDAEIYIDGFHSFTPQEYEVIARLMKRCRNVSIALTLDRPFKGKLPDDLHLFRMTGETYAILYQLALESDVPIERDVILTNTYRFQNKSLTELESQFERRPIVPYKGETSAKFLYAANRRAEVEGIAREIRRLVMEEGYRYKEIALLIRNEQDYRNLIETTFADYDIPYFMDQKRAMLNHPLIELIRSTLEVIESNWRDEPVFRAVKTDLLFPLDSQINLLREQMDRLENYVLAYGIKGDRWTSEKKWEYRRFRGLEWTNSVQTDEEKDMEAELAQSREIVTLPINRLAKRLKQAKNGRTLCEALYLFLDELEIPAKLEVLRSSAEEKGKLLSAREHDQAWNAVIDLLEQFVEILGDERLSMKQFISIIDAGLESMQFSLIPPALDQVSVADLELSRLSNIKVAFIVGAIDGVLPAKYVDDGILTDEDRTSLLETGMQIAPDSRQRLLHEEFTAYRAFTTAKDQLFISCPLADEEGKALQPSPYLKRMKQMFPNIEEKILVSDPAELESNEQLDYISHPISAIAYLTGQLQMKKRNYPVSDIWWDVYNFYMTKPRWKNDAQRILSSLFYTNEAKQLSEQTSGQLYGNKMTASVSRMEQFHSCPFSHFASYGLRLREREKYKLEAPHIGDLFHGAIRWMADEVKRRGIAWADLTKQQCEQLAKEAVTYLAPKLQNEILLSSSRHLYIKRKLEQVIGRASQTMSQHARVSGFSPVGFELGFGSKEQLPPLTFTLKNGTKMELHGRIDRVDQAKDDSGVYLRVIDYKSSDHVLDLTEVYYGFALQMLTYLDIVITYAQQLIGIDAIPAGVFYFHLHNPFIESKKMLTLADIEEKILKEFKMKGLVLEDPDVVRLMDTSIGESGISHIISAGLKKDGTLRANSQSASARDFALLRQHVRTLYKRAGNQIVTGDVKIRPYRMKDHTSCNFCSYRTVCQFDQALDSNEYRIIQSEKRDVLIARIREEGPWDENDHTS